MQDDSQVALPALSTRQTYLLLFPTDISSNERLSRIEAAWSSDMRIESREALLADIKFLVNHRLAGLCSSSEPRLEIDVDQLSWHVDTRSLLFYESGQIVSFLWELQQFLADPDDEELKRAWAGNYDVHPDRLEVWFKKLFNDLVTTPSWTELEFSMPSVEEVNIFHQHLLSHNVDPVMYRPPHDRLSLQTLCISLETAVGSRESMMKARGLVRALIERTAWASLDEISDRRRYVLSLLSADDRLPDLPSMPV